MSDEEYINDEDFEVLEEVADNSSSDGLRPGDKVAPGKVVGKDGKIQKSKGRQIVEGAQNAAEIGAAIASAGASEGAVAAGEGASAAKGASGLKNIGKKVKSNPVSDKVEEDAKEGLLDSTKDKIADKIDKKAEKNPLVGKAVDELADKAKVINSGVGAAKSFLSGDLKGVKDNAVDFIKSIAKEKLKKVKIILGIIAISLFTIIVVLELAIGPIKDAWENFNNKSIRLANNVEKLSNFYRGFGYTDSKSAFFEQLNDTNEYYNNSLDVPLLLATLFYSETMGYDTNYKDYEEVMDSDPVTETLSGGPSAFIEYMVDWSKALIGEAENTYEDGLVYNASKIYRLRRLAAAMSERSGATQTMALSTFINNKYPKLFWKAFKDIINELISQSISGMFSSIKKLFEIFGLRYDLLYESFESDVDRLVSLGDSLKQLLSVVTFGICTISTVKLGFDDNGKFTILVDFIPYTVNYDKYDDYLKDYYFENNPEFLKLLPSNSTQRDLKKQLILNEIYQNKKLFKEIFLKYDEDSSEDYANTCIGGIDRKLAKELQLPVDIADSSSIVFDSYTSFGIADSKMHNGVDLNNENSGIDAGYNVYSIANGVVDDVGTDDEETTDDSTSTSSESGGAWIKIKHEDIVVDDTEYTFYSVYRNLDASSVSLSKGSNVTSGDVIGKVGTTSAGVSQLHFEFRNERDSAIDPTNLFIPCVEGGILVGDTNEEKIWNYLTSIGYSKIAAAGIMGNWKQESSFMPNNLEDGANSKSGLSDEEYTAQVNSGSIDRTTFISSDKFSVYSGGRYGYGLAQWTDPGRKTNFYDFYVANSEDVGDLKMQLDFFAYEKEGYPTLDSSLDSKTSAADAATTFCSIYEGGTAPVARRTYAEEIYDSYKDYVTPTPANN